MQDRKDNRVLTLCLLLTACAAPDAAPVATASSAALRTAPPTLEGPATRMFEQPAISADRIAFALAGDLWTAALDGSDVRRLTSHPGNEVRPRFSPDGKWIAFSGGYDGNLDVFIVPTAGGEPKRLTWHPGPDVAQGFTADGGEVVFTSARDVHTQRFTRLFHVPVGGGFQHAYPLPSCSKAALSPDGKKIAYLPLREAFGQWKNYRGGTASRIWIYDVATQAVEQVPQPKDRCNDSDPMWVANALYFRSDRNGEFNLFRYDAATKALAQRTQHADFPVADASAGGGKILYEQAGWLHLFDPAAGSAKRIELSVPLERTELRERFVDGERYVRGGDISPSGARAVVNFRGEIVTVPAEHGDPRNLSRSVDANDRAPAWSPDGQSIAWVSDAGGVNKLHIGAQDGKGDVRVLPLTGAGFYGDLRWAPDGKRIAYTDNSRSLYVIELESGGVAKIDSEPIYGVFETLAHHWSADSRWIAYTMTSRANTTRAYIYDVAAGKSHALSDGLSDVTDPVFDAGGKYLYMTASTDAGPFNTWFSQASSDVTRTNALYVAVLDKGVESPLAPRSDEEKTADAKKEGEKKDSDKKDGDQKDAAAPAPGESKPAESQSGESKPADESDAPAEVKIDFAGLGQRMLALPLPSAFYTNLEPGNAGQLFYLKAARAPFLGEPPPSALCRYDFESREEKVLLEDVQGFRLSKDKKKVLVMKRNGAWICSVGDKLDVSKGKLNLGAIAVRIDPRAEWAQILDEVWRINRDYFYDPAMHGADWNALKPKYEQFLPHMNVRSDLNRVIRWLCSELGVGHSYSGGGDTLVRADNVPGGLLGADYTIDGGRYRFAKVYGGLNWTPDLRAPLSEPGVDVRAGEYLLAVDGRDLRSNEDVYARFEGTAGKQLELTVGPNADGSGSRTVKVVPIENEAALRNRDWVEGNIRRVTEATNGRVAYVHVPNTADLGFVYFKRYFFPQADRDAIIVDERYNGGGSVADYYIDILRRPYVASWTTRYGADITTPQAAILGPKVMLINEDAGSGGDLLPWMFRKFGLGKLVGRPTWGGLVGILGFPELMDGGSVTAPNLGFWTEEEGFGVENVGVPPDIEVEQLPAEVAKGRDPQLEKAIEVVLAELAANPPKQPKRPPFPVRVRR
ncbi:MAG: peptidase S41 [Planctomycetota bacterium]|nr:MAG: peptidase S41 [Planctomycetota bacterium]